MGTCAIQFSRNCSLVIYKRGICTNCWKKLIADGLIEKDKSYPYWLKELIRIQDAYDARHSEILALSLLEDLELV